MKFLTLYTEHSKEEPSLKNNTYLHCVQQIVLVTVGALASGACSFDPNTTVEITSDGSVNFDGSTDARKEVDAGSVEQHLLLSEVKTTGMGLEFIEIYNPLETAVDLSDVYLADNKGYPFTPGVFGSGPRPAVIMSDFIARFPEGASIAGGQAQVIAIQPMAFSETFGIEPNYRILGESGGEEMREAYPDSVGALVTLTDGGEGIVLFYWDGEDDLVADLDMVNAGSSTTSSNELADKSGRELDGPDLGSEVTSYLDDLFSIEKMALPTVGMQSYARIGLETGFEIQLGTGNGIGGHDETSEDTSMTWAVIEVATPRAVGAGL